MGTPKADRALEAMRNRARKIIGIKKNPEAQEELLQGLLQGIDIRGCNAATAKLLDSGVAPPRIMMTILQCQPILFNLLADLSDPSSWRDLSSRFYRIQEELISLSESTVRLQTDELIGATQSEQENENPPEEAHPPIVRDPDNELLIDWLRNQESLRLFNTFRGVIINANCQLIGIDDEQDHITIELNNELGRVLAADPAATTATLVANNNGTIGFPLHLVDHSPGRATFAMRAPCPVHLDKRNGIDVHIQDLIHVDILRGIYRFPSGTLIDFSATGIGLVAPKDDRVKIALDDVLEFRFQIGMAKVSAEGKIRGLREQGDSYILGVELFTNRATQSLLQREVFRVQREIIVALNEEGIPEEIAPDIR